MYTLGLDTIAGAKILQLKFGSAGVFQPDQAVMHRDRRARFVRISDGAAIIRRWGDSHPVAVPLETLSLPAPGGADAGQRVPTPKRPQPSARAETARLLRHHPRRRQLPRP
jgi:hypothetical protein